MLRYRLTAAAAAIAATVAGLVVPAAPAGAASTNAPQRQFTSTMARDVRLATTTAPTSIQGWTSAPGRMPADEPATVGVRVRTGSTYVTRSVAVERRKVGTTAWTRLSTTATASDGRLAAWLVAPAGVWQFRLVVLPQTGRAGATTAPRQVRAVVGVPTTVEGWSTVPITVQPSALVPVAVGVRSGGAATRRTLQVQTYRNGAWSTVRTLATTATGHAQFALTAPTAGQAQFRLRVMGTTAAAVGVTGARTISVLDPRPLIHSMAPATGPFVGGQSVTLAGVNLADVQRVTFGSNDATILNRTSTQLIVESPLGTLGPVAVRAWTAAGSVDVATPYVYTVSAAGSTQTLEPVSGAFTATSVDWVLGGPTVDEPNAPWFLGLPTGSAVPELGQVLLIRPQTHAPLPSGLAGIVSDVAVQGDDSVRVTVTPATASELFQMLQVDFSGRVFDATTRTATARPDTPPSTAPTFRMQGPTPFECRDETGAVVPVHVGSDVSGTVESVDVDFDVDAGLLRAPRLDAAFTARIRFTGAISVDAAAKCGLKPAWVRGQTKIIPIGSTPFTLSLAPSFGVDVNGAGKWSVDQSVDVSYQVSASTGRAPTHESAFATLPPEHSVEGAIQLDARAGAAVDLGLLDRVGVQSTVGLGLDGAGTADRTEWCLSAIVYGHAKAGFFFDWVVNRASGDVFDRRWDLLTLTRQCRAWAHTVEIGDPEITSLALADATVGSAYSETMVVMDGRPGTWSVVGGTLPAGLALDGTSGVLSGTPTGPVVRGQSFTVEFRDEAGRTATATMLIKVLPEVGVRGGDVQVTLTWDGPADLDLHMEDPALEHIYYARPTSSSGGQLDRDANAGCSSTTTDGHPVENIFWPPRSAPTGVYRAWVQVWSACGGPVDWRLTVRRNGRVILDERGTGTSLPFEFTLGPTGTGGPRVLRDEPLPSSEPKVVPVAG